MVLEFSILVVCKNVVDCSIFSMAFPMSSFVFINDFFVIRTNLPNNAMHLQLKDNWRNRKQCFNRSQKTLSSKYYAGIGAANYFEGDADRVAGIRDLEFGISARTFGDHLVYANYQ